MSGTVVAVVLGAGVWSVARGPTMRLPRVARHPRLLMAVALVVAACQSQAQGVGEDFTVNTITTSDQVGPAAAAAGDGSFIVVWQSDTSGGSDASLESIQARAFTPAAVPRGDQLQVNTTTEGHQINPVIAGNRSGEYVVAWSDVGGPGEDYGLRAQRLWSEGTPRGDEILVATGAPAPAGGFYEPLVAVFPDGSFVVGWRQVSWSICGHGELYSYRLAWRRFDASVLPVGSEVEVATATFDGCNFDGNVIKTAALAPGEDGEVLVAWISLLESVTPHEAVRVSRYDENGTPVGDVVVAEADRLRSMGVDVLAAPDGFAVAWDSDDPAGADTAGRSVQARLFDRDGLPVTDRFQVNTASGDDQERPGLARDADYGFVVVWQSDSSGGSDQSGRSIQAQRYAWDGSPVGAELQVNSETAADQELPDAVGRVVVWQSTPNPGDPGTAGITGQLWRSWIYQDLRGWWRGEGSAEDSSGNGNDGSPDGGVQIVSGARRDGFWLDGASGALTVPADPSLDVADGDFTVALWLRTAQTSGSASLVDTRSSVAGWQLLLVDGEPTAQMVISGAVSTFTCVGGGVADDRFHHVALVVDRDEPTGGGLWVDGRPCLVFDPRAAAGDLGTGEDVQIARATDALGGGEHFAGFLDEIAVWTRA